MNKPNKSWSAFWAALFTIGIVGELVAVFSNGMKDSLSAQVWYLLGLTRAGNYVGMAVFIVIAAWMFRHFFLRKP